MKLWSKLGVEIVAEVGVKLLFLVGGRWSDETKLIINSTLVKF